jgi:hypothetical protein
MYGDTPPEIQKMTLKTDKVYVRFGPLDTQEIPIEWAEKMLTAWREKNASQFGKALAEAATGGK